MTPAWRVAAALARETIKGVDNWGRWERSKFPDPNCDACWGRGGERDGDVPDQWYPCECLRPVPDPSDGAAYLADCARRGVEPGPLPSLSWDSADGRVKWSVDGPPTYVLVRVAAVALEYADGIAGRGWYPVACRSFGVASDWYGAATLVTAAAAALEAADG